MEIVHLVSHIEQGFFLHDDILPFDVIVWEEKPADISISKGKYTHMTLADVSYDFGLSGKMAAVTEKHDRVLLIVKTINTMYLLPWISSLDEKKNVTIVTLGAGVASYAIKSQPEMMDVAMVMPYMSVCEVYDKTSLDHTLSEGGKKYVRVPHGETNSTVFEKKVKSDKGITDLRTLGFEGVAGTVIAPGGVLVNTIHALQHLQNEGKTYDLFALDEYDFQIGKALKESIIKTENVILLLEQRYGTHYPSIVKAKLWDAGLVDTEVHVLYPQIDEINTILPEYLWEQAQWDGLGIATKINSIH